MIPESGTCSQNTAAVRMYSSTMTTSSVVSLCDIVVMELNWWASVVFPEDKILSAFEMSDETGVWADNWTVYGLARGSSPGYAVWQPHIYRKFFLNQPLIWSLLKTWSGPAAIPDGVVCSRTRGWGAMGFWGSSLHGYCDWGQNQRDSLVYRVSPGAINSS